MESGNGMYLKEGTHPILGHLMGLRHILVLCVCIEACDPSCYTASSAPHEVTVGSVAVYFRTNIHTHCVEYV